MHSSDRQSPYEVFQFDKLTYPLNISSLQTTLQEKVSYFINKILYFQTQYQSILSSESAVLCPNQALHKLDNELRNMKYHLLFLKGLLIATSEEEILALKSKNPRFAQIYSSLNGTQDISYVSTIENLDTMMKKVCDDIEEVVQKLVEKKDSKKLFQKHESLTNKILIVTSKVKTYVELFHTVPTLSKESLFYEARVSDTWFKLQESVEIKEVASKKVIQGSLDELNKMMSLVNAVTFKKKLAKAKNSAICLGVQSVSSGCYYMANKNERKAAAELSLTQTACDSAFQAWNTLDAKWIKRLRRFALKKNEVEKKFYLPKIFPQITKESIQKEYQEGTLQTICPNNFVAPNLRELKDDILSGLEKKNNDRVRVRMVSNLSKSPKQSPTKHKSSGSSKYLLDENSRGIIIHIHGGGFVSMSSSVYRTALGKYSKTFGLPVFSIDYRLAPDHPYPAALDDVWQAYNWLVNYCETILDIPTDRIILIGDSAGGNLALSLALRTIKEGVKVPDGLYLSYPALQVSYGKYVPSYFFSLDDIMLPYSVLRLISEAYTGNEPGRDLDPFVSPVVACDELLQRLPPIRIATGSSDPLHDDVWTFLQKLQRLGNDVKAVIYKDLPHAYMSLKLPCKKILIDDTLKAVYELFQIAKSNTKDEESSKSTEDMSNSF